ncbi:MAG: glycosyltransferase [Janthinobacterium lividum]
MNSLPNDFGRVAVIHDWLYVYGGAERVLRSILRVIPKADVFTLFDVMSPADRARIGYERAHTSFLQALPGIGQRHRLYLPLMPLAIEQFDLTGYDLVISSSYAVAKGVLTGPDQLHLSYVHSPMRYAWDLQHQYLAESGYRRGLKGAAARMLLHRMRVWDHRTAPGVDAYAANSAFIARRIRKAYGRNAEVLYPPVSVPAQMPHQSPDQTPGQILGQVPGQVLGARESGHFLTASRLVPYKNVRAVVEAFAALPDQRLVVAGKDPELERLRALAGPNVEIRGFVPDAELASLMAGAAAFVYAAEEDFGIVTAEAQAHGAPVIALGRGGACEIVQTRGPARTGLFFDEPTPDKIAAAVRTFLANPGAFSRSDCHANAQRFSEQRFEQGFRQFLQTHWAHHTERLRLGLPPVLAAVA